MLIKEGAHTARQTRAQPMDDMMFERYKTLFDDGSDAAAPVPALAAGTPGRGDAAGGGAAPEHAPPAVVPSGRGDHAPCGPALELDDWDMLKPLWRGPQTVARLRRQRPAAVARAIDALRTQLLLAMQAEGCTRLAVMAPVAGCGATFVAGNLALSMAAIPDLRTVLLDLDQRAPGLGAALGHAPEQRIADLLGGGVTPAQYLRRCGDNLAIGFNSAASAAPAELLQSQNAAAMMDELTGALTPDVILCDMPPLLEYDDAMAFLPQVDAVLLVADGTRTQAREILRCQKMLEGRSKLMGVVLNRGRVRRNGI